MAEADEANDNRFYDASDGAQVRKARDSANRQMRADADVIRKILMSPQGRAWWWRKLEACRAFAPNYLPGSSSPNDVIYFEGMRKIGLDMLAETMRASTDLYLLMVRENQANPGE